MMTAAANIASTLVEMAQRQPNVDALLTNPRRDAQRKLSYTRTTFQQLNDKSDRLARGLAAVGIATGTRTALCLRPGVDFFATTFALFKLGAIPVLIDPGIGLKNFGRCLAQATPTAFIGIPLAHGLRRLFGWAKQSIRINISTGGFGGISLSEIESRGGACGRLPDTGDQANAAAILFTSGSTGPAKGVLYTHDNFLAQIDALKHTYDIQPGEIDLATFPLFALFGPALGMTTVLPDMDFTRPGFVDPQNIIDPIQQLGITNMFGSPALIDCVSRYGAEHNITLPSLQRVISAGAPASPRVLERFSQMLAPATQIFTPYGATEALPVSSIGSHDILGSTRKLTDSGKGVCIGRPVDNIRVRIIKIIDVAIAAWSDDLELPPNEIGEIVVQGPVVTSEYFDRPDATGLAKIADASNGCFYHRMGDVGYLDSDGRLWFCGRKSQRVRLPERDLFSTPFEAVFNTHPSVGRSALVGIKRGGIVCPVICIEPTQENTTPPSTFAQELFSLAQRYEHTRVIREFLFHPRFPVDIRHNAKINREKLTLWAQRKLA
ncbi:MAG TPA: fatty acid CoA ligase family protein [Phycisphaerae bacterium]|nr:fatty acid CoA ligase family protein [Phycisphaerae bacterium]